MSCLDLAGQGQICKSPSSSMAMEGMFDKGGRVEMLRHFPLPISMPAAIRANQGLQVAHTRMKIQQKILVVLLPPSHCHLELLLSHPYVSSILLHHRIRSPPTPDPSASSICGQFLVGSESLLLLPSTWNLPEVPFLSPALFQTTGPAIGPCPA